MYGLVKIASNRILFASVAVQTFFSVRKHRSIKSDLRTTTSSEQLSSLIVLSLDTKIVNLDRVIDMFTNMYPAFKLHKLIMLLQ